MSGGGMALDAPVYVAGHTGLIGSALVRRLRGAGFSNLLLRTHEELDLTDPAAVEAFFAAHRPEVVFLMAGKAGGIEANRTRGGEFIRDNLAIQVNVMDAARRHGAGRLVFPASACAYPRDGDQPIRPEMLMAGPVEPGSAPFATAKLAGVAMIRAYNAQYGTRFLPVVPATAYGPGDHFDTGGHVISSLMARMHAAKAAGAEAVTVWGTGQCRREFLYVDDLADALILLAGKPDVTDLVNVGFGEDISIAELAERIASAVGFAGRLEFDTSRPDGMPRRLLDSAAIRRLGWAPRTPLDDGLAATYRWYVEQGGRA